MGITINSDPEVVGWLAHPWNECFMGVGSGWITKTMHWIMEKPRSWEMKLLKLMGRSFKCSFGGNLHPGRVTWNLQITQLKRKIIFQSIIFRFHVNLPGCISIILDSVCVLRARIFNQRFWGPRQHRYSWQTKRCESWYVNAENGKPTNQQPQLVIVEQPGKQEKLDGGRLQKKYVICSFMC